MERDYAGVGRVELRAALKADRGLLISAALFSAFVNLLMLTGPIFMLQVYDRVLGARSIETLSALFGIVLFLFLMMGLLDHARARVMGRVGARFQERLDARIFDASLRGAALRPENPGAIAGTRDLAAVSRFLSSPVLLALFDLPWAPIFFAAIFMFHPWLGWLSLAGAGILVAITLLNQALTASTLATSGTAQTASERLGDQLRDEAEMLQALGMRGSAFQRWRSARAKAAGAGLSAGDLGGGFSVLTKTFRLFLQSAMLAMGAWVVLRGEMTGGAMIAGSILMGRALAPVEQVVSGWSVVVAARIGWRRMAGLIGALPAEPRRTPLPRPAALLEISGLAVPAPGQSAPLLRIGGLRLQPGEALGVIGPSGAGKTTFARALCGVWPAVAGAVRLDGAMLDQYGPDALGRLIGYLPQRVTLFDGTIAENIARLTPGPDPEQIIAAAKRAAAHEMITKLPGGYDARVTQGGGRLSGGQLQRIGLARALFGDPVLLVLDEPNANLDNDGSHALNAAVRDMKAAGGSVIIMAHRPAAIAECDRLMILEQGNVTALGPRDEVLRALVQNAAAIPRAAGTAA